MSAEREHDWLRAALAASGQCPDQAAIPEGGAESCDHVAKCPRCLAELALWHRFHAGVPAGDEAADLRWITRRLEARLRLARAQRQPPAQRGWRSWFGAPRLATLTCASASVFAVVLAGALHQRRTSAPALAAGAGWHAGIVRSAGIPVLAPAGELDSTPRELSWRPVPGAQRYEVRLLEVDGAEVWQADVPQASVLLPLPVRRRIVPHKILLWRVVALDGAGRELTASSTVRFRLATQARPLESAAVER